MEPITKLNSGDKLGEFEIVRELGKGGMGVVYLVRDLVLGRQVALKVIAPELAADREFQERFEAEARNAAAIEHPNVVPVYSAGRAGDNLYIAMRYVEGTDLRRALQENGPLAPTTAARIVGEVAAALDAAHAAGLVHRDVKPANVLLAGDLATGTAYLTDFGLTRGLSASATQLTRTGQWIGTLDYVAPEQMAVGGRIDARTDIYSLGCVLYESLAGSVPYTGDEMQKLWAKANEEPPPLPSPAAAFDAVIERAVAREPERRYRSAGDLARAASQAAGAGFEAPTERSVATGAAATGIPEAPPAAPREPAWREQPTTRMPSDPPVASGRGRAGRGRSLAILGGAAAVAAGMVAAALIATSDDGGDSRTVITRAAETASASAPEGEPEREAPPEDEGGGREEATTSQASTEPTSFYGTYFSATLPAGWTQDEEEEWAEDGSYVENTWFSPDGSEEIKIDMSPGDPSPPEESLDIVGGAIEESGQTVYAMTDGVEHAGIVGSQLDFSADSGIPERADFFFNLDGNGFAVMGSAYDLGTAEALLDPVIASLQTY